MANIFSSWTVANWIAFFSFLLSIATAFFLIKNFFLAQKQTKISLSINQFNIFQKELEGLIKEAKEIKFSSKYPNLTKPYQQDFEESDGIYYITLFSIISHIKYYNNESHERENLLNDFRHQIIFPLMKYYSKILQFLSRVKNDEVLSKSYKNILYNYIERDVLQSYLRISNNQLGNELQYDLSIFETSVFDPTSFYKINEFYIKDDLFQYQNLNFYINTL